MAKEKEAGECPWCGGSGSVADWDWAGLDISKLLEELNDIPKLEELCDPDIKPLRVRLAEA